MSKPDPFAQNKYFNSAEKQCDIFQMIRDEPGWVASRFQKMEAELSELRAEVDRLKNVEGELRCGKMVLRAELTTLRKIAECAVEMREVLGYALSKQGYAATEVSEIFGRFNDPVTRWDDLMKGDLNGRN